MNNTTNCGDACSAVGSHKAKICLPVCVMPYAVTSPAIINCCEETQICPSSKCKCKNDTNGCNFVISQVVNIDIPVEFGASVKVGETYVQCNLSEAFIVDNHEYADAYESEFEGEIEALEAATQADETLESASVKPSETKTEDSILAT
ncbi:MAG: hypothetical protein R3Y27_02905 [Clostridia bacterium]